MSTVLSKSELELTNPSEIVIVDNLPQALQLLHAFLGELQVNGQPVTITSFAAPADALPYLAALAEQETPPKLLMTDYLMPQMTGLEFISSLAQFPQLADMLVWIYTTRNTDEMAQIAKKAGVTPDNIFQKGINPGTLRKHVVSALSAPQSKAS